MSNFGTLTLFSLALGLSQGLAWGSDCPDFVGSEATASNTSDLSGWWTNEDPDIGSTEWLQKGCNVTASFTDRKNGVHYELSGFALPDASNRVGISIARTGARGCKAILHGTLERGLYAMGGLVTAQVSGSSGICGLAPGYSQTLKWRGAERVRVYRFGNETSGYCSIQNLTVNLLEEGLGGIGGEVLTRRALFADFWNVHLTISGRLTGQTGGSVVFQGRVRSPPLPEGRHVFWISWFHFDRTQFDALNQVQHTSSC